MRTPDPVPALVAAWACLLGLMLVCAAALPHGVARGCCAVLAWVLACGPTIVVLWASGVFDGADVPPKEQHAPPQ